MTFKMNRKDERLSVFAGKTLPVFRKRVTQQMINRWAEVSGDFNPLHVDPEFGKTTFFGTNIAHGPMILSFVIESLTAWFGRHWISGGRLENVRLVSPVPPGSEVTVGGVVTTVEMAEGNRSVHCEIFAKHKDDRLIITGNAYCQIEGDHDHTGIHPEGKIG
jgi:3-hydroxybutyryl-CoA dehydratase